MNLFITGLNHRSAPVDVRERVTFPETDLPAALSALRERLNVPEALILSTCNRVEIAVISGSNGAQASNGEVARFLADFRHVDLAWVEPYLYRLSGADAVAHLFRVASSLDSMVLGEPQILGQLKSAYQIAKQEGALGGPLETLLSRAFNVAKRVRTETEIGQSAVSVSFAAVEMAREIFGSLKGKRVLLVGAGKMSELAARHLERSGVGEIWVANRTRERAEEMSRVFSAKVIEYDNWLDSLPAADIVITSSGAGKYILGPADVRNALSIRRNRPVFLIDIAVPRNIDPAVNELDNAFLYDIDDLGRVVEQNRSLRKKEAEQAEAIIAEEVDKMMVNLRTRQIGPTIAGLQDHLEQIRQAETERMRSRLGALTPQQQEAVDALTKSIVAKIAHPHIVELRTDASRAVGGELVAAIRRIFRLGDS